MEQKLKHLEFIQNIITRMNSQSFIIKGWVITLIVAILTISASQENFLIVFLSYLIIPPFWILDSFFLSQERQYRDLYNEVAKIKEDDKIDFNLIPSDYDNGKNTWLSSIFSTTLLSFYPMLIALTFFVMYLLKG